MDKIKKSRSRRRGLIYRTIAFMRNIYQCVMRRTFVSFDEKTFVCILTGRRVNVDDKLLEQIIPEPHITESVYKNWFSFNFFLCWWLFYVSGCFHPIQPTINNHMSSTKLLAHTDACTTTTRNNTLLNVCF